MLMEPVVEKLYAMRMGAMVAAWQQQQQDGSAGELSFDERFALIVEAEHLARDKRRLTRLLRQAELRLEDACVEDVKASTARGIDRATLRQLASCAWVDQHLNVLVTGMTGVGKSYLGCALAQAACRRGLRALYRRVPRLFDELALAKSDGSYAKVLHAMARADVLILDDLGLGTPTDAQLHDLLEIAEDRYGRRSTVITSQLPVKKWHDWLQDPTLADAILDRLVHNAHRIELKGGSLRKKDN
jgi:DNA replication protein DnaC